MQGEKGYLELCAEILKDGHVRTDRTGTGTIGLFGKTISYDLREGFPLFTTKKMFFSGIVKELLFFISGETNTKILEEQGVNIWKGNTSREYLDSKGLDYPEGEMGPGYGYQWRHWGGDQITSLIKRLKENPTDRRHIVSAWNVDDIPLMALPPCHCFFQCYVDGDWLDLMMYQRSADLFLGVPFNVASYSLLLMILAELTGLKARKFIHVMGDVHIYSNHVEQVKEQITREILSLPKVELVDITDIDSIQYKNIVLKSYKSHPAIKGEMS